MSSVLRCSCIRKILSNKTKSKTNFFFFGGGGLVKRFTAASLNCVIWPEIYYLCINERIHLLRKPLILSIVTRIQYNKAYNETSKYRTLSDHREVGPAKFCNFLLIRAIVLLVVCKYFQVRTSTVKPKKFNLIKLI